MRNQKGEVKMRNEKGEMRKGWRGDCGRGWKEYQAEQAGTGHDES